MKCGNMSISPPFSTHFTGFLFPPGLTMRFPCLLINASMEMPRRGNAPHTQVASTDPEQDSASKEVGISALPNI